MALTQSDKSIARAIKCDVEKSSTGSKRLKLRTLLNKFRIEKRSDANTAKITELLTHEGLTINPPIVRFGERWEISQQDWIYLSCDALPEQPTPSALSTWNADGWFDRISELELRTEKEVETKFIIPLLTRLGYGEDDRYDGMPVPAAHGSRNTTLVIDFALFNNSDNSLRNQPLLTVEAKKEGRLLKQQELLNAHNQAKSYCLWTQCDFFLVTDSKTVQLFHISRGRIGQLSPIFSCEREFLSSCFGELYARASREALTNYYLSKFSTTEETS
ncbi:type I restriction enzyme HsdR N-terminal domain-containing protein [Pseudomonas sp.]|uniref:type I restriction enzyme HsdR N-terminal domain-containing protein n=1 Tax=Pseudomonas sp. TaxID=306 RepID=UPI002730DF1A|nr:type I restriction enzyme HsdR N-terminal domain-containing protein [Pseudomonas sp.]MDP2245670.1 type I restriction enzyme HsdR N-terminal domain-containing protein [Pseudomonas sp.]